MSARVVAKYRALAPLLEAERRKGRSIALANGCFDLLHLGHLELLEQARGAGDVLVVGINSDASVARLKGEGRPLIPEGERAETLLALEAVDRVTVCDEETPLEVIEALRPDVLVKGADWALDEIVGRDVVESAGGRVLRVELVRERSTSGLIEKIKQK